MKETESRRTPEQPATRRKRFRIARLEERIAPKKGGKGTHNCGGSVGATDTIGISDVY